MRSKNLTVLFAALVVLSCDFTSKSKSLTELPNPSGEDNVAYYWGKVALEATARDTERFLPRPTITSRYLGLIFTAVFDAWATFDEKASPVYLEGVPKRQGSLRDKEIAISYAAYHALKEYYYSDSLYFKERMKNLGLDPDKTELSEDTPSGIGYLAARAVIENRKGDGANQYGEEAEGHLPYFDYTGYEPVNSVDTNSDINRWQPKYFLNAEGERYAPGCLTPYWQEVEPMTLTSADQFRSPPPPYYGSEQLEKEVQEVVELQANLTVEQKALVEFMRDGPKSVQQAGHWLVFAQEISKRDNHNLDQDVKMYFLNQITAMDAFIASWDSKMFYDYARPYALVHEYFKGKTIKGWAGYDQGWTSFNGEQWRPYSPDTFLCPPFPSYVSGHSTVSGACAEALKLYTGSDAFEVRVPFVSGSYTEPESEWQDVELYFPTLTETADMAGISRVLGGYHIQADNIEGLILGRKVAHQAYAFYKKHVGE
jgi:hypothetical protein